MSKDKKEFRYNDRQRSFDESLEESLSSFQSPEDNNDTDNGEPGVKEASVSILDRVARTAVDEVSEIANAPVPTEKTASAITEFVLGGKLREMAAARPAFISDFLDKTAQEDNPLGRLKRAILAKG